MNTALNAAKACCALLGMSVAFSVAVMAAPDEKTPPLTLVSTDTSEAFPFAAIQFNNTIYHVTVATSWTESPSARSSPGTWFSPTVDP